MANIALISAGSIFGGTTSQAFGAGGCAINGERTTGGNWGGTGGGFESYALPTAVVCDFGQSRTINEIDLFGLRNSLNDTSAITLTETTAYALTAGNIKYWNGSSWQPLISWDNNDKVWQQFTFPSITTTKLQINITSAVSGGVRIIEFEAWEVPPDATRPSVVTNLTIDTNFNINSDAATDNVGVDHYRTQYKDDTGSFADYASTAKEIVGNQNLSTVPGSHTRSIRRKAVDAAGNESLNWSNTATVSYTITDPPPPPILTPINPIPYVKIGSPYSLQLQKTGGSGAGAWEKVSGSGTVSSSGLFTINPVPANDFTFKAKFLDENGTSDEETFTVHVSEYAWISFCHKRPLDIDIVQTMTIDEALDEDEEVSEDAPLKRNFNMNCLWVGNIERETLWDFLYAHRLRKKFYWYNPDRKELLKVKLVNLSREGQMLSYGGFEFVLQHTEGDE